MTILGIQWILTSFVFFAIFALKLFCCFFSPKGNRRNSDSNIHNDRHQAPANNHPPRAASVTYQRNNRANAETVPNGRTAQEPGQPSKDLANNTGFIKSSKTGLKGIEMPGGLGGLPSGRSSRSSSMTSDRSPTGSVGSIAGSITSNESRWIRHCVDFM